MDIFNAYILSIVGIVLLGVIVDLMLVDGQVKKYIRSIFVLFVIFTLVSPLPNLLQNIKSGQISPPSTQVSINETYLDIILRQKNNAVSLAITQAFKDNGINGVMVNVDAQYDEDYCINKIIVDLSQVKSVVPRDTVVQIIKSAIKIDKEDIKIYA